MTVRPTMNEYFEIVASSFCLLAFLLRQQLEKKSSSENSAFARLKLFDYVGKFASSEHRLTPVDDRKVNDLGCTVMKPPVSGTRQ